MSLYINTVYLIINIASYIYRTTACTDSIKVEIVINMLPLLAVLTCNKVHINTTDKNDDRSPTSHDPYPLHIAELEHC